MVAASAEPPSRWCTRQAGASASHAHLGCRRGETSTTVPLSWIHRRSLVATDHGFGVTSTFMGGSRSRDGARMQPLGSRPRFTNPGPAHQRAKPPCTSCRRISCTATTSHMSETGTSVRISSAQGLDGGARDVLDARYTPQPSAAALWSHRRQQRRTAPVGKECCPVTAGRAPRHAVVALIASVALHGPLPAKAHASRCRA